MTDLDMSGIYEVPVDEPEPPHRPTFMRTLLTLPTGEQIGIEDTDDEITFNVEDTDGAMIAMSLTAEIAVHLASALQRTATAVEDKRQGRA